MISFRSAALAAALSLGVTGTQAATVTLFTNAYDQLFGIATDGKALFVTGSTAGFRDFSEPSKGVVGRVSLATGKLKTLYTNLNYPTSSFHVSPFQVASDGLDALYWADPDSGPSTGAAVNRGDRTGTAAAQIFGICCGPNVLPGDVTGLAYSGGTLYFADGTGGRIGRMTTAGGGVTQIGPTRYPPAFETESFVQITVADGKVFIADPGENRGVDSAKRQVIADVSSATAPGVRSITTDGASGFVDLSVGVIPRPRGVAAAGSFLYVTSGDTIWRVNKITGRTTVAVRDARFIDLQGVVYVRGALYVLDGRTTFGPFTGGIATATDETPGVIWKVVL